MIEATFHFNFDRTSSSQDLKKHQFSLNIQLFHEIIVFLLDKLFYTSVEDTMTSMVLCQKRKQWLLCCHWSLIDRKSYTNKISITYSYLTHPLMVIAIINNQKRVSGLEISWEHGIYYLPYPLHCYLHRIKAWYSPTPYFVSSMPSFNTDRSQYPI